MIKFEFYSIFYNRVKDIYQMNLNLQEQLCSTDLQYYYNSIGEGYKNVDEWNRLTQQAIFYGLRALFRICMPNNQDKCMEKIYIELNITRDFGEVECWMSQTLGAIGREDEFFKAGNILDDNYEIGRYWKRLQMIKTIFPDEPIMYEALVNCYLDLLNAAWYAVAIENKEFFKNSKKKEKYIKKLKEKLII